MKRHQLHDWPEDRLPRCTAESCGCVIENGQWYTIPEGTSRVLCLACSTDPQRLLEARTLQERENWRRLTTAERQKQRAADAQKVRPTAEYGPRPCLVCRQWIRVKVHVGRVQRYCSVACFEIGRRKHAKTLVCPSCDQTFMPKRVRGGQQQRCCSRSCARYWASGQQRNPHPVPVLWSAMWGLVGCRACGSAQHKHRGQGYCPACYQRLVVRPKRSSEIISKGPSQ